jgi:hypothetical protein
MTATGFYVFSRLFKKIGIHQKFINITLLLFASLPITSLVTATINYDNMLLVLTALYLLVGVRIIQSSKVLWHDYVALVGVGCLASITKYTFLPIFFASAIYLVIIVYRRYGKKFFSSLINSAKKAQRYSVVLLGGATILFVCLFSAAYLRNVIIYGNPHPSCMQTLGKERCLASPVIARSVKAKETKDQRSVAPLKSYTITWFQNMTGFGATGNSTTKDILGSGQPPQVLLNLLVFGTLAGVCVLLYAWRSLRKNLSWYFLLTMAIVLISSVYLNNVRGYYSNHAIFANQPRYLLSILPILLIMSILAFNFVARKSPCLKLAALAIVMLMFTQGGGVVTHILRSNDTWYWQNSKVLKINHMAKKVIDPFVTEKISKYGF